MGPKKKGKVKKSYVLDGVSTTEMSREQLEVFAVRLHEELEREREQRNFLLVERDKLRTFWEITRKQLENYRFELRDKERVMDMAARDHRDELKLFKQKVKHLVYEKHINRTELQAENVVNLMTAKDNYLEQEKALLNDKKDLKKKFQEYSLSHLEEVRTRKVHQTEEVNKLREKFEMKFHIMENKYEQERIELADRIEFMHRVDLAEIEERKNDHIYTLMKNHDKIFSETKLYFKDITQSNLSLIYGLERQIKILKKNEFHRERYIEELEEKNKNLVEPLKEAKAEVAELTRQMKNYKKDQMSLKNTKCKLKCVSTELDDLKWENEVLENRYIQIRDERNAYRNQLKEAIIDVQSKLACKTILLEKKLDTFSDLLETKDTQVIDLINASKLDPTVSIITHQEMQDLVFKKNMMIDDLKQQVNKMCQAHNDLIGIYEVKLQQYGIPLDDLGFKPLKSDQQKKLCPGPGPDCITDVHTHE